jgi:CHAD domain-containing protein
LHKRLSGLTRTLPRLADGDVTALHKARIASRRLRELMPVLQLNRAGDRGIARRLRKITARLGRVRELDVLHLLIAELHEARRTHHVTLNRLAMAVAKERTAARERLSRRLPIDELEKVARRLKRLVEKLRERERSAAADERTWQWALDATVVRRADRLHEAVERAAAVYLPERLHDVRISLKKLRYVLETGEEARGEKQSANLRTLKQAQDVLGRMHDLQVLIDRVRDEQAQLTPPDVSVWRGFHDLTVVLEDECRRLHARYVQMRPRLQAITAKLSAAHRETTIAATTRQVS